MKGEKIAYKKIFLITLIILIISSSYTSSILSNESIQAKESLDLANKDILEMIEKNISVKRVNESYQEALQIYFAQIALEEKGGKASYKLINNYSNEISSIKKIAIQAKDELEVFKESFRNEEKQTNLSDMKKDYDAIITSFEDERFEDTIILIDAGYDKMSQIQSSQTALKVFYLTTTRTIKNFFIKNGLKIIIILLTLLILSFIFQKALKRFKLKIELNNLIVRRKSVNELIKEAQADYFKNKKISEAEYDVKLKRFEEIIRDIDRQIMIVKENIFKMKKK